MALIGAPLRCEGGGPVEKLALKDIFARMATHRDDASRTDTPPAKDMAVLVVDDSRTAVHALQLLLERAGYLIFTAGDGLQAIAAAKRHRPDLILMDIVMPVMNGFEATRALASDPETAAIPVIMVSGSEQAAERLWGARLGAKGFLAKPFNRDELLAKVQTVIAVARRAQAQNEVGSTPATLANPLQR
jgi:twitching motility two-component system response regulator PilH